MNLAPPTSLSHTDNLESDTMVKIKDIKNGSLFYFSHNQFDKNGKNEVYEPMLVKIRILGERKIKKDSNICFLCCLNPTRQYLVDPESIKTGDSITIWSNVVVSQRKFLFYTLKEALKEYKKRVNNRIKYLSFSIEELVEYVKN